MNNGLARRGNDMRRNKFHAKVELSSDDRILLNKGGNITTAAPTRSRKHEDCSCAAVMLVWSVLRGVGKGAALVQEYLVSRRIGYHSEPFVSQYTG